MISYRVPRRRSLGPDRIPSPTRRGKIWPSPSTRAGSAKMPEGRCIVAEDFVL
jgi:hypothetical protein